MTNEENIEWPEVFEVPDYSLLVPKELVPEIGLPPPDEKIKWYGYEYLPMFEKRLHVYEDKFGVWHYILEKDE